MPAHDWGDVRRVGPKRRKKYKRGKSIQEMEAEPLEDYAKNFNHKLLPHAAKTFDPNINLK